jgi:hypothetical protein
MSNFNNLWNNWYSTKVLTEMKKRTRDRVVAISKKIKEEAGLEGLNDSYTRMAAFPEIFGDKLRIVVEAKDSELVIMSKYLGSLQQLVAASLKDKKEKGFLKPPYFGSSFITDQTIVKETKRRLQEDGGGTYEIDVAYYQPTLIIQYVNMQEQEKKEIFSLLKAFNKFKMKEAADYWGKIQSKYTKDKDFINNLTTQWFAINKSHEERKTKFGGKQKAIVYSRAPIDVLRMSDHPMISSCHSQGGGYFQCAVQEAVRGGAIAYSVNQEDIQKIIDEDRLQDIEIFEDNERGVKGINPDGRIRIRRMFDTDTKQEYALPEIRVYGQPPASFQNSVLSWSAENQKSKFTNLETGEFQLPEIKNAIRVGGSYEDNYAPDLYNRLAKKVANSFGIKDEDVPTSNVYIQSVTVDEGLDLMSNCERISRNIRNEMVTFDMTTIANYKIICKNNGKTGIAFTREGRIEDFNDEFNDEFVAIEFNLKYEIHENNIKGKLKTELNNDIIKQIINKGGETSPDFYFYKLYKFLNLEGTEFKPRKNGQHLIFEADANLTFKTVEELRTLKNEIYNYDNDDNNYRNFERAGIALDFIEMQPFDTAYAKRLFRDVKNSDYMFYYESAYGSYNGSTVLLAPPSESSRSERTKAYDRGDLKQVDMFPSTYNGFLEGIMEYFYVYSIPKEALRASLKYPTKERHPDGVLYRSLKMQADRKKDEIIKDIQKVVYNMPDKIINSFGRLAQSIIEFGPTVRNPEVIINNETGEYDIEKDIQIAFTLKINLSTSLSSDNQEKALKLVEYFYNNFYKFRDNLEEQLINDLKQKGSQLVKNLMSDAYLKGIKGEKPLVEPIAEIKKEDIPNIMKQLEQPVIQQARESWENSNGVTTDRKIPFFATITNEQMIRVYYSSTTNYKKINPLEENLYYLDFNIELFKSNTGTYLLIKCPMIFQYTSISDINIQGLNMEDIIADLASTIVNTYYRAKAYNTTYQEQEEYLAGKESQMVFDISKETKELIQTRQKAKATKADKDAVIAATTEDEKQMKMFERKMNKKLIKERLIKWYKRNS